MLHDCTNPTQACYGLAFVVAFLVCGVVAYDNVVMIHDANGLISLSEAVNAGSNYSGCTVYLEDDIDFSSIAPKSFTPIGYFYSEQNRSTFAGTFDGQGHTISNIVINSTRDNTGLFGISFGATIKNVVLDSSFVVDNSLAYSRLFSGSILGGCQAEKSPCYIFNIVNMGKISFTGSGDGAYLGGINGGVFSGNFDAAIENCVNYGEVFHYGESVSKDVGGIVGYFEGTQLSALIKNCLNNGMLTLNKEGTSGGFVGGIAGALVSGTIINSVTSGEITLTECGNLCLVGSVVGGISVSKVTEARSEIIHCMWTNNTESYKMYGYSTPSTVPSTDGSKLVTDINETVINNLNNYVLNDTNCNKWGLNKNRKNITFKVVDGRKTTVNSQFILFQSPAESVDLRFSGWFTDENYTTPFESLLFFEDTTLYGGWRATIKLVVGNGTELNKTAMYKRPYGPFPEPDINGYTFDGWFTQENGKGNKVTPELIMNTTNDHSLYAQWSANNYTLTFDYGNGTAVNKTLSYNETIDYPENLTREGYTFVGWSPKPERIPAHDATAVAQWTKGIASEYVEIVFERKDITKKEVDDFVKKQTEAEYIITAFEKNTEGDVRAIVKFTDKEDAREFARAINEGPERTAIKRVTFVDDPAKSISTRIIFTSIIYFIIY